MSRLNYTDSTLKPLVRNNAFTAVQAAMIAIIKNDPDAASGCLKIALESVATWRAARDPTKGKTP
jgi:hypothetical protein